MLDFYKKALSIDEKYSPADYPDVAAAYNNKGEVHYHLFQYEQAMKHLQESLQILLKTLSSDHLQIVDSYRNIGLVYEAKRKWNQALSYYRKAAIIRSRSFAS